MVRKVRERAAQLRRDLKMVAGGLVGRHPEPFRARTGDAWARRAPAQARLVGRAVTVMTKEHPTVDSTRLILRAVDDGTFAFEPGQFFTLKIEIDGREYRRAYSACGLPGRDLEIIAKRIEGGRVSTHLHGSVQVGDRLALLGPSGAFVLPDYQRSTVLIAGGSGITPVLSMIRALVRAGGDTPIVLFYGNRRRADIIGYETIESLRADALGRLQVTHVLEDPPRGWRGGLGRLDRKVLAELLDSASISGARYCVCGPSPMMDGAYAELIARGVDKRDIYQEAFTRPEDRTTSDLRYEDQIVELRLGGTETSFEVPAGKTILEAALAEGIDLPFSCAMGGCGACRVDRIQGEVDLDSPNCLEPAEVEAGAVLTCVARPRSRLTLELKGKA